jgi:hypothetical protein
MRGRMDVVNSFMSYGIRVREVPALSTPKFDSLDEISFLLVASASNSLIEPRRLDTESLELPYRVSTLFRIHSSTHLML